ncbi:MAG: hypothetical protein AAGH15_23005 [Myxococcota bacterium]
MAAADGWLLSVWGLAADDLHAVGGTRDDGRVIRFDGESWTVVDTGLDVPLLNWVFGFGPDDLWVVGNAGTIVRFDGTSWFTVPSPTTQDLWGVWGSGPDDVWAVGGGIFGGGAASAEPVLLRWDGSAWSPVPLPELDRPTTALFKVWGTDSDDVVAVGQGGMLLRFDGNAWAQVVLDATADLISVWGTGPDRIAIAGGRNNARFVTWDGAEWSVGSLDGQPGLNGVWMGDPDVIHFAGTDGRLFRVDFASGDLLEESFADCPPPCPDFHAIFGVERTLTAVGLNLRVSTGPQASLVYARALGADE